ncbi:MAG: hypothetical protein HQL84_09925 [Magnetococcales bacterium]|nr:hypothetical protein [Magnetococcales bacterium]MBF0150348.1 hypothetical protein [Magnetococcales bacterium]MBF0632142.1 hypothetical protein [Magnetococcales bacterium]
MELVIRPALTFLNMEGAAAERLLLGTAIQESGCGLYLRQRNRGPALGIFQMEPATHQDIWNNWLRWQIAPRDRILGYLATQEAPDANRLVTDLFYAAILCRLHYRRIAEALPDANDLDALANYWKRHYNTLKGRGTVQEFTDNWKRFHGRTS